MADPKAYISIGKCEVKTTFDPKYKTSLLSVMADAIKKGLGATKDFAIGSGGKDAKTFLLTVSLIVTKDDKSKPPKLSVTANYMVLVTGQGTSGQQFKGSASAATQASSKIDEDVKELVKDALDDLTDPKGKMLTQMRSYLTP